MNDVSLSSENHDNSTEIEVLFGRKKTSKIVKEKILKSLGKALQEAGMTSNNDTRITLSE